MCIAWALWRLNAHAERRFDDFARTDVQPIWTLCLPPDITHIGCFPNGRKDLPQHTELKAPIADSEMIRKMYTDANQYTETLVQSTAHCILAELFAEDHLAERCKLPNNMLPQTMLKVLGADHELCHIVGQIRGLRFIEQVYEVFNQYGFKHAMLAIRVGAYVNAMHGESVVGLVPMCARHTRHDRRVLIHISKHSLVVQHESGWVSVASDVNDLSSVEGALACISAKKELAAPALNRV